MKWQYVKENDVLATQWFVKWWDKFSHTQDVIDNVTQDIPVNTHNTISPIAQVKAPTSAYPPIQATHPTTSATKSAKSKKKSAFNGLSKIALIAQLKQSWRDEEEAANANLEEEEDNQESKASLEISIANNDDPCYPCNREIFGHHIVTTPDLAEY